MEAKLISITSLLVYLLLVTIEGLESLSIQQHTQQNVDQGSLVKVPTTSGVLSGFKQALNIGNNSIYKFLSVPYAEAPIGSLRFMRPVELKDRSSSHVDATKFGKTCPQFRHLTRFISPLLNIDNEHRTSEDCLHLNIYVPATVGTPDGQDQLRPNKELPVIVWIPGEGFDFADARQFDGSYLAHKSQSIVVTVQYRVGVLGFLHAPKLNIRGNMGIHDQIMALRWVKNNIRGFGGDSSRVILMGRFSGSMSISVMVTAPQQDLIKSPSGELLFNRVAMLSGIAVDDWIIDSSQAERLSSVEATAVARGFCSASQVKDGNCLQNMPVEQLLPSAGYGWRLVIDEELIGQYSPIEAIKRGQFVSELEGVLIGETGMEGTLCLYRHMLEAHKNNYAHLIEQDRLTSDDLYEIISDDSARYFKYNISKTSPIQSVLASMSGEESDQGHMDAQEAAVNKFRDTYLNACSSYMIKAHSRRFKRNIIARNDLADNRMDSKRKPVEVFHYELKYKPTFSLAPNYIKTAAHGDDIPLIFGLVYNQHKSDTSEADLLMTRKMMSYIGNFVHGNHPLLEQHSSIDSSSKSANEKETISMDENESSLTEIASTIAFARRGWSNEDQVQPIEFDENDIQEIRRSDHPLASQAKRRVHSADVLEESNARQHKQSIYLNRGRLGLTNIRLVLENQDSRFELLDGVAEEPNSRIDSQLIKSQRFLKLQPQLEDKQWTPRSTQTLALHQTTFSEFSFWTMFVFISIIVIFTMAFICLALCLLIVRKHQEASQKRVQHFARSSSSCNICYDSQGGSIDAVLGENNKSDSRGFGNVFDKLRNHNSNQVNTTKPQSTSTISSSRQQANSAAS